MTACFEGIIVSNELIRVEKKAAPPRSWEHLCARPRWVRTQEVGEAGWQSHMLLSTLESYLSSPLGSALECFARRRAKCTSACMDVGMISEGGKMWGDSFGSHVCIWFSVTVWSMQMYACDNFRKKGGCVQSHTFWLWILFHCVTASIEREGTNYPKPLYPQPDPWFTLPMYLLRIKALASDLFTTWFAGLNPSQPITAAYLLWGGL